MNADSQRVEAVLAGALSLRDTRERAAYLDRECANDADLRREVESLLAAHEEAGDFLETPPLGGQDAGFGVPPLGGPIAEPAKAETPNTEQPGDRIGRYRLLEQIGEGGMGVVWMAEQQEPVRRRVALKIIKLGMDTKEVVARFEAERQALALMDHPNIAKVHDGGASDVGRPYFVMELVRGLRITDYCDQHRLSTRQRLELFTSVCQAVQHAHQKGVIHRDLKPSNILVTVNDGVPTPKVIDFGIAKATDQRLTDKTLFTRFMQLMGTPAYMSPEQVELTSVDIDTRSDIYALGVVLYQLLTGHTPFDSKELLAAGLEGMRRVIREREPLRPSTRLSALQRSALTSTAQRQRTEPPRLIAALRGDLDWIVMKCLEKDRTQRYETATSLAQDLQRHLNNEPVVARPPSALYRGQKFVRRYRVAVAVAAGFVLILTAATAVSVVLALWANRERRSAEQATEVARQSEADTDTFAGFLVRDVLATARPKGRQGGLGIDVTVTNALAVAEAKIEATFKNRPRAEATARHAIGVTWRNLGKHDAAELQLRRALEIRERECGETSRETWEARNSYGVLLSARARYAEAARLLERNVEIWRATWRTNAPASTESAVRGMINLAGVYGHIDRQADAFKLLQEAVDFATARVGVDARATWEARTYLASAQYRAGHYEEAARFYAEELAWLMKRRGPDHLETLTSMNQLGLAYLKCERVDEAFPLLTNAFQRLPAMLGEAHPEMLAVRDNMAKALEFAGRVPEAISLAVKNLKLCEEADGLEHPRTVDFVLRLAELYSKDGRLQEALPLFQQAYDRRAARAGPDHRDTLRALTARAVAHERARDYTNAIPLFETVLRRMRTALGTNSTDTLTAMKNLATIYGRDGRWGDALPLYREALEICTNHFGLSTRSLQAMRDLALGLRDAGQLADAIPLMRQAFRGYEAKLSADHGDLLKPMSDLGEMLLRTNAFTEAEALLQRVYQGHQQRDRSSGTQSQTSSNSVKRLVQLYEAWGKPEKAAEWREKLK